jgi:Bifunctional DNA primase/polymerase, N-terminal/Primase C terminal 2 (PriCT-2)
MSFKMKNNRLDAALEYAAKGWQIFPATRRKTGFSIAKRGIDVGTPWGCTSDPEIIRSYWRRLPNANIGLVMGAVSGIWDLEFDTPEGHDVDGAASIAKLEKKFGPLPATLMFESPSGSAHRLYRHPGGDIRIRSGALDAKNFPGIDIRGDGAISVAPPSKTRKGLYKWLNRRRIATAPAWLLDLVVKPARAPRKSDGEPQADIAELTLAMAMIPNPDCDWENWNKVGMALFAATCGSAEGFKLFDAWSQRSSKYNAGKTAQKWKALDGCPPNEIGAGTIFYMADEAVPGWQGRLYYDASAITLIEEFYKLLGEP